MIRSEWARAPQGSAATIPRAAPRLPRRFRQRRPIGMQVVARLCVALASADAAPAAHRSKR